MKRNKKKNVKGHYSNTIARWRREVDFFEVSAMRQQNESLKQFIKIIAVDWRKYPSWNCCHRLGFDNLDLKVEVWASEWESLETLRDMDFENDYLIEDRNNLKEENEKLLRQLEELQRAFDEVRLFNPPHALKNKKQKI